MKKLLMLAIILCVTTICCHAQGYYGSDKHYYGDDEDKKIEQNWDPHCHLIWTKGDKPGYLRVWVEVEGKLVPAMYIPDGYVRPGGGWAFYHEWSINGVTLPLRVLPAFWKDPGIEAWLAQLPSDAAKIDWRMFLKEKRRIAMENLRADLADEWARWHCDIGERVLILPTVRARGLYFGKTWNLISQEDRDFYVAQFETGISMGKLQQKLAEVLGEHDLQERIAQADRDFEEQEREKRKQEAEAQRRENERRAYEDAQRQYGGNN